MRSEVVTLEPEIVQLGRDHSQTLKIINQTASPISNFFFCLYNTQKFSFSPESFSLAPNQHKLVTVSLRIKSSRSAVKEFAYLKSTDINKRITLVVNQFQSPDLKVRSMEEGFEDMNTLSSREYRDVQTQAIQKIIKEKQAYIALLQQQRESVNRNLNFKTEQSGQKSTFHRRQLDELEMKLVLVQNEKQSALKQNIALHHKFQEYQRMCQTDLKNYERITQQYKDKIQQNAKLHQEVTYLENQGSEFLSKIDEKEVRIRELELANKKLIEDGRRQADAKLTYIEQRLHEQKMKYQQSSGYAEERIKELQKSVDTSNALKQKVSVCQRQLAKKEEEVKALMAAIESQRSVMKEIQEQRKRYMKLEVTNQAISQKNSDLSSRIQDLQKVNYNLREQIFVCKSKMVENDASSDKMNQYLEIALQSCKNQNQALKRTKRQLQKSLQEIMTVNRQSHESNQSLAEQVTKYKEEVKLLHQIKDNLQRRLEQVKQEHHLTIMQLKTQNIELLEKLSLGSPSKREETIRHFEEQIFILKKQLAKSGVSNNELNSKNEDLMVENAKLIQKVKKYKREAKKQLRNINETAINQLNKEQDQKQKMAQRINQLEEVILNYSCEKLKLDKENLVTREGNLDELKRDRSSSRAIGIKDQRKEIQYSQSSHSQAFNQLGELRQIHNFIKSEEDRFNKMFCLKNQKQFDEDRLETRPMFKVIKFFQRIERKLDDPRKQDSFGSQKEIDFLKSRVKQLENVKEQKENLSSINLNKTRQHCSQLLQYVRQQMKCQYKKLNETVKLQEQKFDLLKKKIYEEYRARIIDTLNKRDRHSIAQIQTILERFIQGLGNLSHKEAVLQKEIKLKQSARRQNSQLKDKVNQLNFLLQERKGHCTRDPVKLIYNQTELQWQQSLKRQAELLTLSAEYQRLKQELQLVELQLVQSKQETRQLEKQLDDKSSEVLKLKKYQIEIQSNYESQIQRQYQIIEENKKKVLQMAKTSKETNKHSRKEKEYHQIKESCDRQKQVIRQLKDKEKLLEEILEETHRSEEKEKKKANQEQRIIETMRDLKENNRILRSQNSQLKQKMNKLEQDLQKKTLYMKNLRGDMEQNRIRVQRKQQVENDLLRDQNKKLGKQIDRLRQDLQKIKKKKEKQYVDLRNELDKLKNEKIITEKSLQSIIRALMDTVRKVYSRLKRILKKRRGKQVEQSKVFEGFKGVEVNALKVDEIFDEIVSYLEEEQVNILQK